MRNKKSASHDSRPKITIHKRPKLLFDIPTRPQHKRISNYYLYILFSAYYINFVWYFKTEDYKSRCATCSRAEACVLGSQDLFYLQILSIKSKYFYLFLKSNSYLLAFSVRKNNFRILCHE